MRLQHVAMATSGAHSSGRFHSLGLEHELPKRRGVHPAVVRSRPILIVDVVHLACIPPRVGRLQVVALQLMIVNDWGKPPRLCSRIKKGAKVGGRRVRRRAATWRSLHHLCRVQFPFERYSPFFASASVLLVLAQVGRGSFLGSGTEEQEGPVVFKPCAVCRSVQHTRMQAATSSVQQSRADIVCQTFFLR